MAIYEIFRSYMGRVDIDHYHPEVRYFLLENFAEQQKLNKEQKESGSGRVFWNFVTGKLDEITPLQ